MDIVMILFLLFYASYRAVMHSLRNLEQDIAFLEKQVDAWAQECKKEQ